MQDDERQFQLVGTDQLLRKRADRIGVKLRIGRGKIDQVIRVRENGAEFAALCVIEKGANFFGKKGPGKPLHVVLHKNLHRGAANRARALNRAMHPAADRHMGAEEDL